MGEEQTNHSGKSAAQHFLVTLPNWALEPSRVKERLIGVAVFHEYRLRVVFKTGVRRPLIELIHVGGVDQRILDTSPTDLHVRRRYADRLTVLCDRVGPLE